MEDRHYGGRTIEITPNSDLPDLLPGYPAFAVDAQPYSNFTHLDPKTLNGLMYHSASFLGIATSKYEVHIDGTRMAPLKNTSSFTVQEGERVGIFSPELFAGIEKDSQIKSLYDDYELPSTARPLLPALVMPLRSVDPAEFIFQLALKIISPTEQRRSAGFPGLVNDLYYMTVPEYGQHLKFNTILLAENKAKDTPKAVPRLAQYLAQMLLYSGHTVYERSVRGRGLGDGTDGVLSGDLSLYGIRAIAVNDRDRILATNEPWGGMSTANIYEPAADSYALANVAQLVKSGKQFAEAYTGLIDTYEEIKQMMCLTGIARSTAGPGQEFEVVFS